jgi:hypothetical protein
MNRILKRPMFKMGGSSGTGITSGLDRKNYQFGGGADARRFGLTPMPRVGGGADARRFMGNRMMQMASPMNTNQSIAAAAPTLSTRERLTQALGAGSNRNLGQFLTQFGLNLLSQSPTGNIFQTAATAAQEPTQGLFDQLNREQDLKRQIALEAERLDIGQEQATELQLLKNLSEDESSAIKKQAREGFESGVYASVDEGIRDLLDIRRSGIKPREGEVRQEKIDTIEKNLQAAAASYGGLNPIDARSRATFFTDFEKILKENDDLSQDNFDLSSPESPFWSETRDPKEYKEGLIYYDPITKRYYERDTDAEIQPNVPRGFSVREVR